MGNVALWKYSPPLGGRVVDGEMKWKLQAPATVEGPIKQIRVRGIVKFVSSPSLCLLQVLFSLVKIHVTLLNFLQWGSNKHLLSVNTIANVFMLNEQVMSAGFKEQVSLFLDLQIMSGFFSFFFFLMIFLSDSDLQVQNCQNLT